MQVSANLTTITLGLLTAMLLLAGALYAGLTASYREAWISPVGAVLGAFGLARSSRSLIEALFVANGWEFPLVCPQDQKFGLRRFAKRVWRKQRCVRSGCYWLALPVTVIVCLAGMRTLAPDSTRMAMQAGQQKSGQKEERKGDAIQNVMHGTKVSGGKGALPSLCITAPSATDTTRNKILNCLSSRFPSR